jgi:hypothetical protein
MYVSLKPIFIALTLILFLFAGCDKNQKIIKTLEGTWSATSYVLSDQDEEIDLVAEENYQLTIAFETCKLKDDSFCSLTWTSTEEGEPTYTTQIDYRVVDYGKGIEMREVAYPSTLVLFHIKEFEGNTLILDRNQGDGDFTIITLNR